MRIFVAEERNGQQQAERAFASTSVGVGRDGSQCQIVFDGQKWPMVSRKHAEFRLENGRWLLVDANSRFGTFLDGRQISEPSEIHVGSRTQFGSNGPVLRVVRIEQAQSPVLDAHEVRVSTAALRNKRFAAMIGRHPTSNGSKETHP